MFKRLAGYDCALNEEELSLLKKVYSRSAEKIQPKGYDGREALAYFILQNYKSGSKDERRLLAAVDRKHAGLAA